MRFSSLTDRIAGKTANAWAIHFAAITAQAKGEDVVVMSVGESDWDSPQAVIDHATKLLHGGDTHYTEVIGRDALRSAVATYARERHNIPATMANVAMTVGCQNALFSSAALLMDPGTEALVPEPMYVTYEAAIGASGARLVPVPCPADMAFRPDVSAMEAAVTDRTRAIFMANPVNPTGVVFNRDELESIAAIARANDLWVVSDQVYADLVYDGDYVAIAALDGMAERTVSLGSLSKSHAMTGWRTGWMIGPEELIDHMDRLAMAMTYGLPGFIQNASVTALETQADFVERMRADLKAKRDAATSALSQAPGLDILPAASGMFLLIGVKGTGLTSADFCRRLFAEHGVSVLDGATFGDSSDQTIRLSFAGSYESVEEGCRRIKTFADGLQIGGATT